MSTKILNLNSKNKIVVPNEGKAYSDLIQDYIQAFKNDFPKDFYFEDMIELALSTWNFANFKSFLPKKEFQDILSDAKNDENFELIDKMINYKCEHYNEYNNFIADYDLRKVNGKDALEIISQSKEEYLKNIIDEMAQEKGSFLDDSHFVEDYIDRRAITIRYKKPLYAWLNDCYPDKIAYDDDGFDSSVYLIQGEFDKWIKKNYDKIYQQELGAWNDNKKMWPKNRKFKMFNEWFKVVLSENVFDFEKKPIFKGQEID